MVNVKERYKAAIAQFFNLKKTQISLYWKGRVGLFALLANMEIKKGDEVILPAFTCVVVPNAILYLGAKPIYVDIDPHTFNINPALVAAKITDRTKLIIAQNTFGLSSDLDALLAIAQKNKLKIIEDCTHGFGGTYKNKKNGTVAEAAFFSAQWNKTFSTGIGGFVICKNEDLAKKIANFENTLTEPSFLKNQQLKAQLFVRNKLLPPALYWPAIKLYRFLSKNNIITGSSQGAELTDIQMPENYLLGSSTVQAKQGLYEIENIEKNLQHRQKIAALYQAAFTTMGFAKVVEPENVHHTFIQFPFLVKDRAKMLALAAAERISLNDWFISPIHPITENWEQWHYKAGSNPIAEKISQHILNLPTALTISEKEAQRIIAFLEKNKEQLIDQQQLGLEGIVDR